MLMDGTVNHELHQKELERRMTQIKVANEGRKLTIMDYANKLGISGPGVENIRELFETGRF
jgi:hypothetical protein